MCNIDHSLLFKLLALLSLSLIVLTLPFVTAATLFHILFPFWETSLAFCNKVENEREERVQIVLGVYGT